MISYILSDIMNSTYLIFQERLCSSKRKEDEEEDWGSGCEEIARKNAETFSYTLYLPARPDLCMTDADPVTRR